MNSQATRMDAYKLMHDGALTFADMHEAGICVDVPYFEKMGGRLTSSGARDGGRLQRDIDTLREEMDGMEEGVAGRKVFGKTWDVTNNNHLGAALLKCGYDLPMSDKSGQALTNKEALDEFSGDFMDGVRRVRKLMQLRNTFIAGILREAVDGYIHPMFNLHLARSFRPSTDSPNQANVPRRDKESNQIIRGGITASEGCVLTELDYKANEVKSLAAHTKDKNLVADVSDPKKDMHRDQAMELFLLKKSNVSKDARDVAKNGFVFPSFYGSYWFNTGQAIWRRLRIEKIKTEQGVVVLDHLASKGITHLGNTEVKKDGKIPQQPDDSYLAHMQNVEGRLWDRYELVRAWQDASMMAYKAQGYFDMLTGFRCSGIMSRNAVYNYRIQGSAFHWLLWSLIQLNRALQSNDMETVIVNQVYDSILLDGPIEERDAVVKQARVIMEHHIKEHYTWINVPLKVDVESTPVDGAWCDKEEI